MVLEKFDQETTRLIPDNLDIISPTELTQYYIKKWELKHFNPGSCNTPVLFANKFICWLENINEGIKMEVTFKRRLTNELLTTYLPSFFLLGICYATTHFKPFYFEAAVTVNLTVMLVATTLFVR